MERLNEWTLTWLTTVLSHMRNSVEARKERAVFLDHQRATEATKTQKHKQKKIVNECHRSSSRHPTSDLDPKTPEKHSNQARLRLRCNPANGPRAPSIPRYRTNHGNIENPVIRHGEHQIGWKPTGRNKKQPFRRG